LCASINEDYPHILRCEHAARTTWRDNFLTGLRDFFIESNTSPLLSSLMMDGVRQWFRSTLDIRLSPEKYHPSLRHIIIQQNNIGWTQLFLGRFSVAWSQHQSRYNETQNGAYDRDRPCTAAWQANLIQFVWARR
jgi:hypothetical protein